ncbi:MAG: GGDEF domain-containing protein [Spirochaetales bacterium]|nr:GGDEF domain-containing protein [Spirochaetales bacterium]
MKLNYYLETEKRRYTLRPGKDYLIGRSPKHDVFLSDPTVSRNHARMRWDDGSFVLEDMNSTNGTWINTQKIITRRLEGGEIVQVGRIEFEFIVTDASRDTLRETVSPEDSLVLESRIMDLINDVEDQGLKERFSEISRLFTAKKKNLSDLAYYDGLTGLFNRHSFDKTLHKEWRRRHRYKRPLSLMMIDIDHFKQVNDTHGHQKGDSVLKTVSRVIHDNIRSSDYPCRYGGEEIAVVLPETTINSAVIAAEKLRRIIETQVEDIEGFKVTVSIGVSSCTTDMADPRDIVERADRALYMAKDGGRNRVSHL